MNIDPQLRMDVDMHQRVGFRNVVPASVRNTVLLQSGHHHLLITDLRPLKSMKPICHLRIVPGLVMHVDVRSLLGSNFCHRGS